MPKKIFPVHPIFFVLFLVLGQSQLGNGNEFDFRLDSDESQDLFRDHYSPPSFRAVSSLFFQPGTDYEVVFTVDPHRRSDPLQLKCILMADLNNSLTIESESIFLRPGKSGQISIPLPPEMPGNETKWQLFAWSVTEESPEDGYLTEAPRTLIESSDEGRQFLTKVELASVFILTDKPAYKPDDLVRIRVVTMGSNDLPHLTAGVNLTITDSQGNVMKKWEQPLELPAISASTPPNGRNGGDGSVTLFGEFKKKKNGLSAYEYQLSSEPIFGKWTIEVQAGNIKEKVNFDVKKYILPKFQVKIHIPPVLYGTGELSTSAKIEASYTYGKGLEGAGTLTVTSDDGAGAKLQQIVVKDGEAIVPLKLISWQPTVHTITANVSEKNTGRWQSGTATVRSFPYETYYINWINKPSSYKPGFPITVQLKITGRDGLPVKEVRSNALSITLSSSMNLPASAREISISIPLSGIVTFSFPTPLQPLPFNSKFFVQYKTKTQDFTLPTAERGSSSGIFIDVVPPPDSVQLVQGESYNFTIMSNKPIQPDEFHYRLSVDSTKGIHEPQLIKNKHSGPATEFPFLLQIPNAANTKLRVNVYFTMTEGGRTETISSSKSIDIRNYLKIRVSRPIPVKAPASGINNSTHVVTTSRAEPEPPPQPLLSNKLG